jgi:hypothetical protein
MAMVVLAIALLPLLSLLPCVHLLPPHKKNREKKIGKKGQKGKNCNWGHSRKRKKGSLFHFNKKTTGW